MHFLRIFPVIFSMVLLAAHFLRFHGILIPIILLMFLPLLFYKHKFIPRVWQAVLLIAGFIWINTTIDLVLFRLNAGMPWIRLAIIMATIILFTLLSGLVFERKIVKQYYHNLK